jgi:hypothetical protein
MRDRKFRLASGRKQLSAFRFCRACLTKKRVGVFSVSLPFTLLLSRGEFGNRQALIEKHGQRHGIP